jgi:DNA-binding NtrC family response regulator
VRELRNVVERAASLADAADITADDLLPWSPGRHVVAPAPQPAPPPRAAVSHEAADAPTPASPAPPPAAAAAVVGALDATLATLPFKDAKARVLEVFEPAYLAALLERHGGNITRSAAAAGLTRYHLRELCKRYNLRDTDNEPE